MRGELIDTTERRRLEERCRQAQKMEAAGKLAGGIAHDFNNILTAILGYSNLLADELPADGAVREDIEGIRKAANRASNLTRQLLAFSRRQPFSPKVLDLNAAVQDAERLAAPHPAGGRPALAEAQPPPASAVGGSGPDRADPP